MRDELPNDMRSRLGNRIAYGEAARLHEMAAYDHGWGRDFAAGVGGGADATEREVLKRLSPEIAPELVRLAVQDVVDQRKPR